MRRPLQILMIFIILCTSSSHLAVLQMVAWTSMFIENVQEQDLDEAISRTLGGEHPCNLCSAIEEFSQIASEGEDDEAPRPSGYVLDLKLLPLERVTLFPPRVRRIGLSGADQSCEMRMLQPVVPPPRAI